MSKIDNFAYPTAITAKIWGCSLGSRSVMLGSAESKMVRLISREIIFQEFEPIWSRYLNVTDRRTTCHGNTALRVASRGKNYLVYIFTLSWAFLFEVWLLENALILVRHRLCQSSWQHPKNRPKEPHASSHHSDWAQLCAVKQCHVLFPLHRRRRRSSGDRPACNLTLSVNLAG